MKIKIIQLIFFVALFSSPKIFAQSDTIIVNSFKEAMNILYGSLDSSQQTTDVLINRSPVDSTFLFFDGKKDSAINYLEFLLHYNNIQIAKKSYIEGNPFLVIDSAARSKSFVPLGINYFEFDRISDSAVTSGNLSFQNGSFVNSSSSFNPFENRTYFSFCPMAFSFLPNTDFRLDSNFVFTNKSLVGVTFLADFNNGMGIQPIAFNQNYSINFESGVNYISLYIVNNTDTLKAKSEIFIFTPDSVLESSRSAFDCEYIKSDIPIQTLSADNNYGLVKEGNPTGRFGVWLGCGNDKNGASENSLTDIRKPYIVSGGFNPLKGKSLDKCNLSDLSQPNVIDLFVEFAIAQALSGLISATTSGLVNIPAFGELATFLYETDAYGGWRGPIYETYNGRFNKFFSPSSPHDKDNGTKYFEKLREEGYDIIIVTYDNPVDYLENNAAVLISLIKQINTQLQYNGSKCELIVGGYSAGALTSRVALAEMERYYIANKGTSNESVYPHPHTRMFMSVEGEYQGANTPLGFQHTVDYLCKSLTTTPIEILEVILAKLTRKQFSNHTAKELSIWHYEATDNGFTANENAERGAFTLLQNQIGFPMSCRKVGIAQGSSLAKGYDGIDLNEYMFHIRSELQVGLYPLATFGYYREFWAHHTPVGSSATLASREEGMSITSFGFTKYINLVGNYNKRHTYIQNCRPLDICPASLLAADRTFSQSGAKLLFGTVSTWANPIANNLYEHQATNHSFAPTISCLDIHDPNNPGQEVDLYFNINLNGLTTAYIDKNNNNTPVESPNRNYGYPHILYPNNHYTITPFDAIWAVGDNIKADNHFHVEDPQPDMCDFMVGEVAPEHLYLSNRTINEPSLPYTYHNNQFGTNFTSTQYQAAYDTRRKIFCGNDIYYIESKETDQDILPTKMLTPNGDFIIGPNGDVEFIAGEEINFLPGFEAQQGSNFLAYIWPNPCSNDFELNRTMQADNFSNTSTSLKANYLEKEIVNNNSKVERNYNVFPIPASESISIDKIESTDILQVTISDIYGKQMQRIQLSYGKNSFSVSEFSNGIYLLRIEKNGTFIQVEKIVISHP